MGPSLALVAARAGGVLFRRCLVVVAGAVASCNNGFVTRAADTHSSTARNRNQLTSRDRRFDCVLIGSSCGEQ